MRWIFCAVLYASSAFAVELTEAQAVELALKQNPEVIALRQSAVAAGAGITKTALLANPEVRYGIYNLANDDLIDLRRRANVALQWKPPSLADISGHNALLRTQVKVEENKAGAAENRLAAEVRLLFRTITVLDEQRKLAERQLAMRQQIASALDEQVRVGVKSAMELEAARLLVAEAQRMPSRIASERRLQEIRLASKIGVSVTEPLVLRSDRDIYGFAFQLRDRAQLVSEAVNMRKEVAAAKARCEGTGIALQTVKKEQYPWFSTFQVTHRGSAVDSPGRWGFQVGVEIPVFKWRPGFGAVEKAQDNKCRLDEAAVEASIKAEVEEVLARLEAVSRDLADHQKTILDLAKNTVDVANHALKAGQADKVEPMLAEVRLMEARQTWLARVAEYWALEAGLDQALGRV